MTQPAQDPLLLEPPAADLDSTAGTSNPPRDPVEGWTAALRPDYDSGNWSPRAKETSVSASALAS